MKTTAWCSIAPSPCATPGPRSVSRKKPCSATPTRRARPLRRRPRRPDSASWPKPPRPKKHRRSILSRQAAVDGYVKLGVAEADARLLTGDAALRSFFDSALEGPGAAGSVARWIVNELLRELKEKTLDELPFGGVAVSELAALVDDGKITGKVGKDVLAEMLESGTAPSEIVEKKGLRQVADAGELEAVIDGVLAEQADNVALYKGGKTALMGFFVGQVMKATRGQANAPGGAEAVAREAVWLD